MKHLLATLLVLFITGTLSAQLVTKLPVPQTATAAKDSITDPLITEVNAMINAFNSKKSDSSFNAIVNFLKKNTLDPNAPFYKVGDSLLRSLYGVAASAVSATTLTPLPEQKIAAKVKGTGSETCPLLSQVSDIKVEKNEEAEYVVSFVDKNDKPLKSFILTQFNEELYKDKIRKGLYSLCSNTASKADTAVIEALWVEMKKQNLYTQMLEASLEVKDDDVMAGELRITRKPVINLWINNTTPLFLKTKSFDDYKGETVEDSMAKKKLIGNKAMSLYKGLVTNTASILSEEGLADERYFMAEEIFGWGKKKKDSVYKLRAIDGFTAYNIEMQFQDGFIENIKVEGKWDNCSELLKFENTFPIPFSTKRDFRKLQNYYIYERTFFATGRRTREYKGPCSIRLGDLLFYSQNLAVNSKDYSPYNHVYKSTLTDSITIVNMYKEKTSKILELKIFSDLKGIEGDNPNGLVQLELSKKLNFWNNRSPLPRWANLVNVGVLNSFTPYFTMNKIENNNRRLIPSYLGTRQNDTTQANVFASTLKLMQYQVFGLGVNINGITVDIPGFKSTLSLNTGFYFGRTLLQDTLREKTDSSHFKPIADNNVKNFGVNTFQIVPEICWQIYPDKRYGITLSQKFINFRSLSDEVKQVRDSAHYTGYLTSLKGDRSKIDNYSYKKWLGSTEIYAFYKPSEYNSLFFRYRFNWDLDHVKENFHQIQLGISTYLTHTKKDKKEQSE